MSEHTMKDTKYDVLTAVTAANLVALVREAMADGWRPAGGLCVVVTQQPSWRNESGDPTNEYDVTYLQAVVR
jgi:hypothetical protein